MNAEKEIRPEAEQKENLIFELKRNHASLVNNDLGLGLVLGKLDMQGYPVPNLLVVRRTSEKLTIKINGKPDKETFPRNEISFVAKKIPLEGVKEIIVGEENPYSVTPRIFYIPFISLAVSVQSDRQLELREYPEYMRLDNLTHYLNTVNKVKKAQPKNN